MKPLDAVLVLGATMRLTRLVVTDDLGRWAVRDPAYHWAGDYDPDEIPEGTRQRLVSGLDCPFCVGTWIGFGILAVTGSTSSRSRVGRAWRFLLGGLALNEVAGHLASRLGDAG